MIKRAFANLTTRSTTYFKNRVNSPREMAAMGRVAQLEDIANGLGDSFKKLDETDGDHRDGKPGDAQGTVHARSHSGFVNTFEGFAKLEADGTPTEMHAEHSREYPLKGDRFNESVSVQSDGDKKIIHFRDTFHGVDTGYHGGPYSVTKEEWVIFDGPNKVTHKAIEY